MIELAVWNLTIPVGVPATVIDTPELVGGYQSDYFKSSDEMIRFWAPVNGTTTEDAIYPRSELRETYGDGSLHNWTYPNADNFLRAALEMDQVPSTGKVVIGQIHAYKSTSPMLKLEYQYKTTSQTGNIVAKYRKNPDSTPQVITIASGIKLNERFTYSIHLSPGGMLSVTTYGKTWSNSVDSTWKAHPLYFKAGVYPQDNSGYETEAGAATFYRLEVEHRTQ